MNNVVSALAASGDNLYAGGVFTLAGGSSASRVAKWDGNTWSALGSGVNNSVLSLATSLGNVYATGTFGSAGGTNASRVARWNGVDWLPMGSGLGNIGSSIAVSGTNVFIGGTFLMAGGKSSRYFGIWHPPVPVASMVLSDGNLLINSTSEPNQSYRVLATSDLSQPFDPSAAPSRHPLPTRRSLILLLELTPNFFVSSKSNLEKVTQLNLPSHFFPSESMNSAA